MSIVIDKASILNCEDEMRRLFDQVGLGGCQGAGYLGSDREVTVKWHWMFEWRQVSYQRNLWNDSHELLRFFRDRFHHGK